MTDYSDDLLRFMDVWWSWQRMSVYTTVVARVESYDAATQTAKVVPVTGTLWRDRDTGTVKARALPALTGVPVLFRRGGGMGLAEPLVADDYVLVMVSTFGIARWFDGTTAELKNKPDGQYTQPDHLTHQLEQCFILPGAFNSENAFTDLASAADLRLGKDDDEAQIHVTDGGEIKLGATATELAARADRVESEIDALWTAVNGHVHNALGAPPAANPGIGLPGTAGSVGADIVKVK